MNIQRGFRDKLEKYVNVSGEITVEMQVSGRAVYDYCCFGIDAAGKLSDDRYMVFYNQPQSPEGAVCYADNGGQAQFRIQLQRLPQTIQKLVFTVSIDGDGTMGQIASHRLCVLQNGQNAAELTLTGKDFHEEKAIISLEIYRKDVWRLAAVASGFNGGLGDLLREYGGEAAEDDTEASAPPQNQASASPYGNTPAQNPALSSPYGNTQAQNPALSSPYGNTQAQNPALSSPYGNTQAQNPALSSPYGNTPAQNPALSSPYGNTPTQNQASAQNKAAVGTYATPTPQGSVPPASPPTASYPIPTPQGAVPPASPPTASYPIPTPQGSVPPTSPPTASYPIPTPQGSVPPTSSSTPAYSVPSGQNYQAPMASPAQSGYTQPPNPKPPAQSNQPQSANSLPAQNSYTQSNNPVSAPATVSGVGGPAGQPMSPSVSASGTPKVSLEKKLKQEAPKLVSLAKPLELELEKRHLQNCVARVALVMDLSGSMRKRYRNGAVQDIINKTMPIAVQFDDDGELDCWYYGTKPKKMPSVNLQNYTRAVPEDWQGLMKTLGGVNNEPPVMKEVVAEYKKSRVPAYVLFITDGGVSNESKIRKILEEASHYPIFWQFVGVGGSNYGILERLNSMQGRYVDNAGFFALDDFRDIDTGELYGRLLNEFPAWLSAAKAKGIIQ